MLKIVSPSYKINKPYNITMDFMKCFIENLADMTIGSNTHVITSYADMNEKYDFATSTVLKFPSSNSGFYYGANSSYNGYECSLNPLFIDSGFKLITSNHATYGSGYQHAIAFANVDVENLRLGGIESQLHIASLMRADVSTTDFSTLTCKLYNSENTIFGSCGFTDSYILFTRLKPFNLADGTLHVIMFRALNNTNKDVYIMTNSVRAVPHDYVPPVWKYDARLAILAKDYSRVFIDDFILMNKWYSEDICTISGIDYDAITTINGDQYYPLGMGLFLKLKQG